MPFFSYKLIINSFDTSGISHRNTKGIHPQSCRFCRSLPFSYFANLLNCNMRHILTTRFPLTWKALELSTRTRTTVVEAEGVPLPLAPPRALICTYLNTKVACVQIFMAANNTQLHLRSTSTTNGAVFIMSWLTFCKVWTGKFEIPLLFPVNCRHTTPVAINKKCGRKFPLPCAASSSSDILPTHLSMPMRRGLRLRRPLTNYLIRHRHVQPLTHPSNYGLHQQIRLYRCCCPERPPRHSPVGA